MNKQNLDPLGGKFPGLDSSADEFLRRIQRSIINAVFTSRHSLARDARKHHRHYSAKAKARKKVRRRMVAASRRANR